MDEQTKTLYALVNAQQILLESLYIYITKSTNQGRPLVEMRKIMRAQVTDWARLPWSSVGLDQALEIKPRAERLLDLFFQDVATLTQTDLTD